MHSRNRSPSSVPRPQGGRFPDASVHINQCSAVAEILEKREKNGEMTEFGSTNLLETIDIALGRIPGSSSYRTDQKSSGKGSRDAVDGANSLFHEHCDNDESKSDGRRSGENVRNSKSPLFVGGSVDLGSQSFDGIELDTLDGQDDNIFTDVEDVTQRIGCNVSNTAHNLSEQVTETGDLNNDDMLSAVNPDDPEESDQGSLESSTQYSEAKDDDEDEEVIMLSVVLNPTDSPFHDAKHFDSALDCSEAISPIYL